jgi:hypothetical protein
VTILYSALAAVPRLWLPTVWNWGSQRFC